jgi:hypothetical protein
MLGEIPDSTLDLRVNGVNLVPGTLRDQLAGGAHLLIFLRHFGCLFCRETLADLRAAAEADPGYPPVLLFFQGSPTEGRALLRRYWPAARAVSDPELRVYAAFGIHRGNLLQLFGPGVWAAKRRAEAKGHQQGERTGDVFMMPGVFLVQGGRVLWSHQYRHAGDHPDLARIPELLAGAG